MWWSFNQWTVVGGLLIAFLAAVIPVAVELTRRRAQSGSADPGDGNVVEIEERFLNYLTGLVENKDYEILELKQQIIDLREDRSKVYRQRDAAYLLLSVNGIPLPNPGENNDPQQ